MFISLSFLSLSLILISVWISCLALFLFTSLVPRWIFFSLSLPLFSFSVSLCLILFLLSQTSFFFIPLIFFSFSLYIPSLFFLFSFSVSFPFFISDWSFCLFLSFFSLYWYFLSTFFCVSLLLDITHINTVNLSISLPLPVFVIEFASQCLYFPSYYDRQFLFGLFSIFLAIVFSWFPFMSFFYLCRVIFTSLSISLYSSLLSFSAVSLFLLLRFLSLFLPLPFLCLFTFLCFPLSCSLSLFMYYMSCIMCWQRCRLKSRSTVHFTRYVMITF